MMLGAIDDRRRAVTRLLAANAGAAPDVSQELEDVLWTLDGMRIGAIKAATSMNDPFAVPYVLDHLSDATDVVRGNVGRSARFVMLEYLAAVAPRDEIVSRRLKELVETPDSPLHNDWNAHRTLERLGVGNVGSASRPSTATAPSQ